jgi:DNA helicase II / ATP-dependent DNA helicase PcrA
MSPKVPFKPNIEQRAAIEHVTGPMLVRAGAGTGKTAVLVERITRLIVRGDAQPGEIVATTFTLKAVAEINLRIRARVEEELGPGASEGLRVMNFHQWCERALKEYRANFDLLTKEQLYVYLRQQIDAKRLPLRYFQKASNPAKFLEDLMGFMDRCQDELVSAARYRAFVRSLRAPGATLPRFYRSKEEDTISPEDILARCEEVADVYETVEALLSKHNLGSFGHLIVRALELFRNNEAALAAERARSRFILIDEFQDSNLAQIELADLLTAGEKNIFAVGDPDQAIYRFRGASSAAFQAFMQRFPQAKTVTLAENYRSHAHILACAHGVIKGNVEREAGSYARKPLVSFRGASEAKVELVVNQSSEAEALDIADCIQSLIESGADPAEIAVLYRQHNHRDEIARELERRKIPFAISGTDLFRTDPVRDVIACLGALDSATDHVSLFRLAMLPRFGVDLEALRHRLRVTERERGVAGALQGLPAGKKLLRDLADLQKLYPAHSADTPEIFEAVVKLLEQRPDAVEIQALRKFIREWSGLKITSSLLLGSFIKYLDYFQEGGGKLVVDDRDEGAVQLTTTHNAKGLEFEHVFVLRVSSGSFPSGFKPKLFEFPEALRSASAFEAEDDKSAHEEEERRLFYVAVTRARDTLALHAKRSRAKAEPLPLKYMRELGTDRGLKAFVLQREAVFRLPSVAAAAQPESEAELPMQGSLFASAPVRSLSASAIDTYQTCPLRFKFAKEDGIPDEAGAALQYGNAMHRVLHDFYQARMAGRVLDEVELLERFRLVMRETRMEDPLQYELYDEQGVRHLRALLAGSARVPVEVVAIEENFSTLIEGVTVRGRFDRVDRLENGKLRILDYKTGKPKDEKAAEDSLQLALYALAAADKYGEMPAKVAFHNIEDDTLVEITPAESQLKEARDAVSKTADGIAQGRFNPKPGYHCKWCAYSILCPAMTERVFTAQPVAAVSGT